MTLRMVFAAALAASVSVPAARAEEDDRARVAILGLQASGIDATVTGTLTGLLGTEISRLERYRVLAEDDVRGLVAATALAQALGCEGDTCAANFGEISAKLNAGLLVSGAVGRLGSKFILNLSVIEARTGRVQNRASVEAERIEDLPARLRAGVLALFGIAGQLVLWNQPDGAQVFLNEKLVGLAPVRKIDLPREGEYTVRVYRDDSTPFETNVSVKAGEVARVKVDSYAFKDLDAWASERRAWGWGLVTGGVAAIGASGALVALAYRSDRSIDTLDLRRPADVERGREIAGTTFALTVGSAVTGALGLALAGGGGWLLADNPWQDRLDRFAFVPTDGGGVFLASSRF